MFGSEKEDSKEETNIIDRVVFPLSFEPEDYAISTHINNLYATFGEERVKNVLTDLFLKKESA